MKNKAISFLALSFLLGFSLLACKEKSEDSKKEGNNVAPRLTGEAAVPSEFKSKLRPNQQIELKKVYVDTVSYLEFSDEGDEWIFIVEKNKDTFGLVYNKEQKSQFVTGDKLAINWKMDSIRYAGDSEFLYFTEYLISAEKTKSLQLTDKNIQVLWRETQYDEALKADTNNIILNEAYIKNISAPEKAALGYVATFIGNECEWDGFVDESRSTLKCKILWALNLGYQCSNQHLYFLKFWFRNNEKVLKELEACPTKPDGATINDTFNEIKLEVNGNTIIVYFKGQGYNIREGESWSWTEKHFFEFNENELVVLKKEVSPIERNTFELQEN